MFVLKTEDKKSFLSGLKEAAFFVAIYLYFIGFIYIYYFYEAFGIPLRVLDTPVYFYFVYSYNVAKNLPLISWTALLSNRPFWLVVILLYVLSVVVMTFRSKGSERFLLFVFLVALFPCLSIVAFEAAQVEAERTRSGERGVKEVTLLLKTDSEDLKALKRLHSSQDKPAQDKQNQANVETGKVDEVSKLLSTAELNDFTRFVNANGRNELETSGEGATYPKLYLITETSTSYYVLFQPRSSETDLPGYVYEVPKTAVLLSSVRIQ